MNEYMLHKEYLAATYPFCAEQLGCVSTTQRFIGDCECHTMLHPSILPNEVRKLYNGRKP